MMKKRVLSVMLFFVVFATMSFARDNDKLIDILKNEINYNIDVRARDYAIDNAREPKNSPNNRTQRARNMTMVPDDNEQALRNELWRTTDEPYKNAVKRFENVKTNVILFEEFEVDRNNNVALKTPFIVPQPRNNQ